MFARRTRADDVRASVSIADAVTRGVDDADPNGSVPIAFADGGVRD
jgi:hypothetical protein